MADAYVTALRLLARRELSEAQVRARLARREFESDEIDAAVARLQEERALDDPATLRRMQRYLLAQGFDAGAITVALRKHRHHQP